MQFGAITKGLALGMAAGAAGYFISVSSSHEKSKLKRKAVKAAHAIGAVMDAVADMLH